ncbi:MAG TPA: PaaI family thioesterase [Burkholderiaceae bacterium]|nr:PaaI family thioesterase [Burkholderiaceae bacterium]
MRNLTEIQTLLEPLLPGLLGVRLTSVAPDVVRAEMDVRPQLCTVGGVLHGGAIMAFADTLGAIGTAANLGEGQRTTTTDSSTKFIAAAKAGTRINGECIALHRGRSTMVWQTSVRNSEGKLCAVVIQTQLVLTSGA